MTNEYKIIKEKNQTRFVLETTSAGGGVAVTGGGSIAAAVSPMGRVHKRSQEESEQIKTRNPGVPALGKKTGGGAHRDRKKEMKQGKEKHKKPFAEDFKEPDHEISMAKNELRMIYKSALELFQLIKQYSEMEGLEAWQQSKITKAADYLHSVLQSLSGDRADKGLDEQGVAEGLEDSNIQSVIIDTVERLFRRNNIGDYDSLEAVRQGVKHHFSKPGANVDSAIEGILNILSRRMRKQGNYNDLSRFKDALSQGIRHQLKNQGVTEGITPEQYRAIRNLLQQYQIDLKPDQRSYEDLKGLLMREIGKLYSRAQTSNLEVGEDDFSENKIKGVDGKACWKGKRYAGRVKKADGTYKDKCVPVGEDTYTESLLAKLDQTLSEKAPPEAKYKRMAKHIKASYKGSGLDKDEIAQRAFGATWKAAKRAKK